MKHFSRAMLAIGLASVAAFGHTTDLLDVYRDAQNNDPVVGAAEAGYLASQEAIPQARSLLLPGLNASASTSKSRKPRNSGEPLSEVA